MLGPLPGTVLPEGQATRYKRPKCKTVPTRIQPPKETAPAKSKIKAGAALQHRTRIGGKAPGAANQVPLRAVSSIQAPDSATAKPGRVPAQPARADSGSSGPVARPRRASDPARSARDADATRPPGGRVWAWTWPPGFVGVVRHAADGRCIALLRVYPCEYRHLFEEPELLSHCRILQVLNDAASLGASAARSEALS